MQIHNIVSMLQPLRAGLNTLPATSSVRSASPTLRMSPSICASSKVSHPVPLPPPGDVLDVGCIRLAEKMGINVGDELAIGINVRATGTPIRSSASGRRRTPPAPTGLRIPTPPCRTSACPARRLYQSYPAPRPLTHPAGIWPGTLFWTMRTSTPSSRRVPPRVHARPGRHQPLLQDEDQHATARPSGVLCDPRRHTFRDPALLQPPLLRLPPLLPWSSPPPSLHSGSNARRRCSSSGPRYASQQHPHAHAL